MIPNKLKKVINNDPEDIEIFIKKVNFENQELKVNIIVSGYDYEKQNDFTEEWEIETKNYRTSKISFNFSSNIEILTEHSLLWEFVDKHSELYFNGTTNQYEKLFTDLYKVHYSSFQEYASFQDTINKLQEFGELIQSGNGLLAKGPNKLLENYGKILTKHNIKYSIIGNNTPIFWNGNEAVGEDGLAKLLFIDDSYIIADEFMFIEKDV